MSSAANEFAFRNGQTKKRNNAIVALLSGGIPAAILFIYFPCNWERCLLGLIIGLFWGNGFEYAYHRWLLHRPRSMLAKGHLEHHMNVGTSPCFRIAMICSSLCRVPFTALVLSAQNVTLASTASVTTLVQENSHSR
jgi:hypothetical protein